MLERCLLVAGLLCVGVFTAGFGTSQVQATRALAEFDQAKALTVRQPDMSLWSKERIDAYGASVDRVNKAIGVLKIDRVSIEAPIFSGASDAHLDRGIGWIEGTTPLGAEGNVGLAGHRDGFFRGLKDVRVGDEIRTETLSKAVVYAVTATDVVSPQDVYVLEPTSGATLTLVTCHPFYFAGSAPERFVVYAVAVANAER